MRPLPAPLPTDLALGVALATWWLASVDGAADAAGTVSLVLSTIPLGWRRSAPLAAAVLAGVGFAVAGLGSDPPEPLAQLAATLIAVWSVAVHAATWRSAILGLVAIAGGGACEALLVGNDLGFILILAGATWAAGAAVRRQHGRSASLEMQAAFLADRARAAAAEERERIARELHDVVSHTVSLMVVHAGAAEQVLRSDPPAAERALRTVQEAGRAAVDDLRRMLGLLRGPAPDGSHPRRPQPGLAAIDELIARHGAGVTVERHQVPTLPPGVDLSAYRIVQESLTNARKHAPGMPSTVRIAYDGVQLDLVVRTQRPQRAETVVAGTGHGIVGMRERVALYGGHLDAGFDPGGDWVVHATLPAEAL